MQRPAFLALTLTVLTLTTLSVKADVREPDAFHFTVRPLNTRIKNFQFDLERGNWSASVQTGDAIVSEQGHLDEADRNKFFEGLEASGAWHLQSTTQTVADQPWYRFVVTRRKSQHEAEFSGTPGPDYDKMLKYVSGTLVGHEQQVLTQKLGGASAK